MEPLQSVVENINDFGHWSHAQKIRFFAWFLHSQCNLERFTSVHIKNCYDLLHLEKPSSIPPFLSEMEKRKPKEAMKDAKGYYLARHVRSELEKAYGQQKVTVPKTEKVLPISVVANTRGYLERAIQQANGCYEARWFEPCMVLIRKFVEILIIEVYEAHGKAGAIKDNNGEFFTLSGLITQLLSDSSFNLGRDAKRVLPEIKAYGDKSARNRRYLANEDDVNKLVPELRFLADELLHLAKLR